MTDIFRYADRQLVHISRYMSREFQNLSVRLNFDELNVLDVKRDVTAMYERIDREVRTRYRRIIREVYREGEKDLGIKLPPLAIVAFLTSILKSYDPTTQFVYTHEWTRKRDREIEAIMSSDGRQEMRKALKRGLDVTYRQVAQEADDITVAALLASYEAGDVPYVRWVTEQDDRVCRICRERDGKIYRISEAPPLPAHWRCRCRYVPVRQRTMF